MRMQSPAYLVSPQHIIGTNLAGITSKATNWVEPKFNELFKQLKLAQLSGVLIALTLLGNF